MAITRLCIVASRRWPENKISHQESVYKQVFVVKIVWLHSDPGHHYRITDSHTVTDKSIKYTLSKKHPNTPLQSRNGSLFSAKKNCKNDETACCIGNKPTKLHSPYTCTRGATETLLAAHIASKGACITGTFKTKFKIKLMLIH